MEKQEVLRAVATIRTYLEGIEFILDVDPNLEENENGVANLANQLVPLLPDGVGALRINDKLYGYAEADSVWTLEDVNQYVTELMQQIGLFVKESSDSWL